MSSGRTREIAVRQEESWLTGEAYPRPPDPLLLGELDGIAAEERDVRQTVCAPNAGDRLGAGELGLLQDEVQEHVQVAVPRPLVPLQRVLDVPLAVLLG